MKYRREIDGLRAFAVLPVVAFHARLPGFSGGYVGVDVFFVISGFLITTILIHELNQDKFSLFRFYERRARRILPALFFMMFVSAIGAYLLMAPDQFLSFGQSIVAVVLFLSNVLFWLKSDYFAPAAEESPLLHTWSLAVEEQYYLFFPIVLLMLWGFRKDIRITVLCVIATASFVFSQYAATAFPSANFYLLPSRVWELLIGSLCAFGLPFVVSARMQNALAAIGFAALIASVVSFTSTTPFPSVYTLLPVIGTALILLFANSTDGVGYVLQNRIFVGIGLVSYSFYLWHQPLFAFYRIEYGHDTTLLGFTALSLASFLLAVFSWRYVERPFRAKVRDGGLSQDNIFGFSALCMGLFLAFGLLVHKSIIALPFELPQSLQVSMTRNSADDYCFDRKDKTSTGHACAIGAPDGPVSFALVGDSHSLSAVASLSNFATTQGQGGIYHGYSGCPPLLEVIPFRRDENQQLCPDSFAKIYGQIAAQNISDVILIARWSLYTGAQDAKAGTTDNLQLIGTRPQGPKTLANNRAALAQGLRATIAFAQQHGIRLHIMQQVPQQPFNAKSIYYRALSRSQGITQLDNYSVRKLRYDLDKQPADALFTDAQARDTNVTYHQVDKLFCKAQTCPVGTLTQSYYFDDDHLSVYGAQKLTPVWEQVFTPQ